jgi:GNAT superfamily N-acetyltransferase
MHIEFERSVPAAALEGTWVLYNRAFDELRRTAVQRHVMYRDEFDQVMADERVWKYRGVNPVYDGAATALATFTNELGSIPLISPDYFAHRWPDLYAGKRIWYIGFFAIDPGSRGKGIFEWVISHMWDRVRDSRGIALLDICRRNAQVGLPDAIHNVLLSLTPEMRASRIDEQTYWLYEPEGSP